MDVTTPPSYPAPLIVYNRDSQELLRVTEHREREDALNDRWDAELRHREEKNVEIVVLAADSEDALRSTHGRYFRVAG